MSTNTHTRTASRAVVLALTRGAAWSVVALVWTGPAAAQTGGAFTPEQASAGRGVYELACARCHMADLGGAFEAPALAGPNFAREWATRPASDLIAYIQASMPPGQGRSLSAAAYASLAAYLRQVNGSAAVTVGGVSTVASPPTQTERPSADASATSTFREIDPFVPVSDATLHDPDPGDWLMYRRTYDGWGYSPLDQITRDNVHQLSLAWVWAMPDGTNEPTPLVRDGVLYLANPGNVIQALEADTGTLLWEYRRPLPEALRTGFNRNLAIFEEKLYLASIDAYLVALDARTGSVVWETWIADYQQGYTNSAGPLVVEGIVINGINECSRFQPDSCFITGHDARTGEELWRTLTIAEPGTPVGDTWGDLSLTLRGGGDSWITGSYDPELGLVYSQP